VREVIVNETTHDREAVDTAAKLLLVNEMHHARLAVLQKRDGVDKRWETTPDWRFARHVVRMALYMRERAGTQPGHRVAIVGRIGALALVAEWAGLLQGLAVGALASTDETSTRATVMALSPRVLFVEDVRTATALLDVPGVARVIVLGGEPTAGPLTTFTEALDLGGTLDTAERAQSLRASARAVPREAAALAWPVGTHAGAGWRSLTQGELVERIRGLWADVPPRSGAIRHFADAEPRVDTRVALHACVTDGVTCLALGPPQPVAARATSGWLARTRAVFRDRMKEGESHG
jgi:hypothetical protein